MKTITIFVALFVCLLSLACQTTPESNSKTQAPVKSPTPTTVETPYQTSTPNYPTPTATPDQVAEKAKLITDLKMAWTKIDSAELDKEDSSDESPSWKSEAMKGNAIKTDSLKLAYQQLNRFGEFEADYEDAKDQIALSDIDLTQEMVNKKQKEKVSKYISALQVLPKTTFEEVCLGIGDGSTCLTDGFEVLSEIIDAIESAKLTPTDVGMTPEKIRGYAKQVFDTNLKNAAKDEEIHPQLCEMTKEWKFSLPTTLPAELSEKINSSCE